MEFGNGASSFINLSEQIRGKQACDHNYINKWFAWVFISALYIVKKNLDLISKNPNPLTEIS